mmetsp:Transcript_26930/g.57752  ORF Transcript_26930/g.57752 Transcript_26930/m.57752 type:complete len:270 (-) Transcript_26930:115-924(-)
MYLANKPYSYYVGQHQGQATVPMSLPPSHANAYQGRDMERSPTSVTHCTSFSSVKPTKKSVTFKPTCTVGTHTRKGMTKEEKSRLYYSKQELEIFNLEAHAICTLSIELPDIFRNTGPLLSMERQESMLGLDDNIITTMDTLRGLELIMYPKRKQNKLIAQRSLLKYQTLLNSKPNVSGERKHLALAAASAKLNMWSSLVALETARLDVLRAYEGKYMLPIAPPVTIISPFPFYKKRRQQRRGSMRITYDGDDISQHAKRRKVSRAVIE